MIAEPPGGGSTAGAAAAATATLLEKMEGGRGQALRMQATEPSLPSDSMLGLEPEGGRPFRLPAWTPCTLTD